jgi:DNA-binding CsgD family transcriptional regulator
MVMAVTARSTEEIRVTAVLPESPVVHQLFTAPRAVDDELKRSEVLRRMTRALDDLGALTTVEQLVEHVPAALCRVGFDRAMVSRIEDARWVVQRFHSEVDPDGAAEITAAARANPQRLSPAVIELEMVRRRVSLLVTDVSRESRVHRELADITQSSSYVAAPVAPEGEVVGFLHADRLDSAPVTTFDRDVITLFAQQFGALVRTAWLRERFERMRSTMDTLRESLGGMVAGCLEGGVDLAPEPAPAAAEAGPARPAGHWLAQNLLQGSPEVEDLLSAREQEVLRLMALGETNTRIASKLVISEGTVKSHVRHILRKLNAANRAEAVCRWLQRSA